MRWFAYFILAYCALAVHVAVGPYVEWRGVAPNLVLLAAVYIAMNAPRERALLGCFCMGLLQDLLTGQPLGGYAFAYGLVGLFVVSAQQAVYRNHPLTHVSLALVGGLITAVVVLVSGFVHPPGPALVEGGNVVTPAARPSVGGELLRVLYTALLAPFVLWGLNRLRRGFAFQGSYRKIRR